MGKIMIKATPSPQSPFDHEGINYDDPHWDIENYPPIDKDPGDNWLCKLGSNMRLHKQVFFGSIVGTMIIMVIAYLIIFIK